MLIMSNIAALVTLSDAVDLQQFMLPVYSVKLIVKRVDRKSCYFEHSHPGCTVETSEMHWESHWEVTGLGLLILVN